MQITADPALKAAALLKLRDEYGMDIQRPGMHQSELSYCLTKAYWNRREFMPPSETEAMLFAIGFAMERVVFKGQEQPEELKLDGISLSLDSLQLFGPVDLKTTRMRAAGRKGEGGFQVPEGWKRQMAAYTYAINRLGLATDLSFGIVVIHLVEPEITAWRLSWEWEELQAHWDWLLDRSNMLESMLAGSNPMPYQSNEDWECKGCRYLLLCQLYGSTEGRNGA